MLFGALFAEEFAGCVLEVPLEAPTCVRFFVRLLAIVYDRK